MKVLTAAWIVGVVLFGADCRSLTRPSFREIGNHDWDVVFRVPEGIYSMTSSPDSALFVVAFSGGGPIYRSRPGHDTEWSKVIVTQPGQPIFRTIYAASAITVFGSDGPHLLRWDEGKGITDFGAPGPWKTCGMSDIPDERGFAATSLWGRGDRDVFAVGTLGMVLHYDGTEWKPMHTPIRDETKDVCAEPSPPTLFSVGGDEHDVFAAGTRYLRLSKNGEWTELPRPRDDDDVGTRGIAAQGGKVFFAGTRAVRTDTNPPRLLYFGTRLVAFAGQGLLTLPGYDNVVAMNGGGAQPGSAAVFWSFDKDVLIIDGSSVRVLRVSGLRSVRGAVAVGHTIYVAGLARGEDDDVVVRLR